MPHYSDYQYCPYKNISKLHEKGLTFNQIADHLNKKKIFRGGHIHSIIKRKRVRDEKLKEKYPEVRSDFYLDIYDNSLILKL